MTEAFLHYLWKYRLLRGNLATTEGQAVAVNSVGEHNRDAGPDFLDARITLDGLLWAGNVEIHVKSSDWNLHRHGADAAYDNVILHVVYEDDMPVMTHDGRRMPTLVVKEAVPTEIWEGYAALMQPSVPIEIPCMLRLQEIPSLHWDMLMERLAVERLERKAKDVRRLLDDSKGDWESCCYWMVARYLGGKTNAFAFEMLAKMTPLRCMAKMKDSPFRLESMLMGQAGLLEGVFEDEYPKRLQQEYAYQRHAYSLTPMEGHLWKFFRLRPAAFPTIRISQLADLVGRVDHLFSRMLEMKDAADLCRLFDLKAAPYWNDHYRFDQESAGKEKRTGRTLAETLIINAWVPLLFEYGVQTDNMGYKDQALDILGQMAPENNRITRLWAGMGMPADNATGSQAQIQLYDEYCKNKRCLDCGVGYRILKKIKNER